MADPQPDDLIILVADKDMEAAFNGILSRPEALGIRSVSYKIFTHLHRDPGCRLESHTFLRHLTRNYSFAVVVFDREGCGKEGLSREQIEVAVERNLHDCGWVGRSIALAIDPELETWVWSESIHVDSALGWTGRVPNLRTWLREKEYIKNERGIPDRPKEAMEAALRIARKPRSSNIYSQLAKTVSFRNCTDPTFNKLRDSLQLWFREAGQ